MFKAIYHLFAGKPFAFYSAYTLPNAIFQLHGLERMGGATLIARKRTQFLMVTITPKHEFTCHQNFGENIDIHCKGRLEGQPDGVYVVGRTYIGLISKLALTFAFIWWIIWTYTTLFSHSPHMTLLGFGVITLLFYSIIRYQNELHNTVLDTLGKSKKKKH